MIRKQTLDDGYPDLLNSYTYHIWCRTTDRAALGRRVYRGSARGTLEFLRPSFNEPWDPGPPTADLFEPAPIHPHTSPRDFVPTPEPTGSLPPTIAVVTALGEFDYRVTRVANEGNQIHVSLQARRDPDRNRLRELYVDAKTLELKEVIATDKLYDEGDSGKHVYPMLFTVTLEWMHNMPIVTHIHGTPTYQTDAEYLGHRRDRRLRFQRISRFRDSATGLVLRSADVRAAHRRRAVLSGGSGGFALINSGKSARSILSFGRSLKTM